MENKNRKWIDILTFVNTGFVLVLAGLMVYILFYTQQEPRPKNPEKQFRQGDRVSVDLNAIIQGAAYQGNPNAPTKLVLFNSFTCGYCAKAVNVIQQIQAAHGKDLTIVFKHFLRNSTDQGAGHAFECAAEQGKPWQMYHMIFAEGVQESYLPYAKKIGLNTGKFTECMKSEKYYAKMENDLRDGLQVGINGTPSFLLNDRLFIGYIPYENFEQLIAQTISQSN